MCCCFCLVVYCHAGVRSITDIEFSAFRLIVRNNTSFTNLDQTDLTPVLVKWKPCALSPIFIPMYYSPFIFLVVIHTYLWVLLLLWAGVLLERKSDNLIEAVLGSSSKEGVSSLDHCFSQGDHARDGENSIENGSGTPRGCDSSCSHGQPFFK